MDKELVKELYASGFTCPGNSTQFYEYPGVSLAIPLLSELIEACGDDFGYLLKSRLAMGEWQCSNESTGNIVNIKKIIVKGLSPEEVVARLWLELNKSI